MSHEALHQMKAVGDLAAAGIVFGTIVKSLPTIAAALTVAWYIWRFAEKVAWFVARQRQRRALRLEGRG